MKTRYFSFFILLSLFFSIRSINFSKKPAHILVKEWCMQELDREEKEIKERLCNLIGISFSKFEKMISEYRRDKPYNEGWKALGKFPGYKAHTLAKSLLKEQGIDEKKGNIILGSYVYTTGLTIVLDQNAVNVSSNDELSSIILHEIMHIKNNDFLSFLFFNTILKKYKNYPNYYKINECIVEWRKLCERRADIQAGLVSKKYAYAFYQFWKNKLKQMGPDSSSKEHPSYSVRMKYMQDLYNSMEAESNKPRKA